MTGGLFQGLFNGAIQQPLLEPYHSTPRIGRHQGIVHDVNSTILQLILEPLVEENDFKPGASLSSVGTDYDQSFGMEDDVD